MESNLTAQKLSSNKLKKKTKNTSIKSKNLFNSLGDNT
jgi:hypothetical protein